MKSKPGEIYLLDQSSINSNADLTDLNIEILPVETQSNIVSQTVVPKTTNGTPIELYNGATNQQPEQVNAAPESPWFEYQDTTSLLGGTATKSAANGVTTFITDNQAYAGFTNYGIESEIPPVLTSAPLNNSFPVLNRNDGFVLSFTIQVKAEDHTSSGNAKKDNRDNLEDRAGFTIIALSNDNKGVEIGFWENRIWVQDDGTEEPEDNPNGTLFTQAEGVNFDTKTALVDYDLAIKGNDYTLYADDTSILSGKVRDYTAFDPGSISVFTLPDPYELDNLIFFGDNTPTSSATVDIEKISIATNIQDSQLDGAINGTSVADVLVGTRIDDTLNSLEGNDLVIAHTGKDTINGGDGNDIIFGDRLGHGSRNRLGYSRRMKDIINGDDGDDIIRGGVGDDEIDGGLGSDRIWGEGGDDMISGGLGEDILRGGVGKDSFRLDVNQGTDTIVDFEIGEDIITLGNLVFSNLSITDGSNGAVIQRIGNSSIIAILNNVQASQLDASSFTSLL